MERMGKKGEEEGNGVGEKGKERKQKDREGGPLVS